HEFSKLQEPAPVCCATTGRVSRIVSGWEKRYWWFARRRMLWMHWPNTTGDHGSKSERRFAPERFAITPMHSAPKPRSVYLWPVSRPEPLRHSPEGPFNHARSRREDRYLRPYDQIFVRQWPCHYVSLSGER